MGGEVDQLAAIKENNHQCVAIWAWTGAIIKGLRDRGLIDSDMLFQTLQEQVQNGRSRAQLVMNQLACPLPLSYVALIGFVVKVHNFSYAFLLGCLTLSDVANQSHKMPGYGKTKIAT